MRNPLTIPCWENEAADWQKWKEELNAALKPLRSDFFNSNENTKRHHAGFTFLQALLLADEGGTFPLARFIRDPEGRALLSERDWCYLAVALTTLQQPLKLKPARPYGSKVSKIGAAEHYAARLVAREQAQWRRENQRQQVPSGDTDQMIRKAIKQAADKLGVSQDKISKDYIRTLLKTGRIMPAAKERTGRA